MVPSSLPSFLVTSHSKDKPGSHHLTSIYLFFQSQYTRKAVLELLTCTLVRYNCIGFSELPLLSNFKNQNPYVPTHHFISALQIFQLIFKPSIRLFFNFFAEDDLPSANTHCQSSFLFVCEPPPQQSHCQTSSVGLFLGTEPWPPKHCVLNLTTSPPRLAL